MVSHAVIPITGLLTLLSILILTVSLPPVWSTVYRAAMPENMHKFYVEDAKRISDGIWQQTGYTQINQKLHLTKSRGIGLGAKEIDHFEDVREMVQGLIFPAALGILFLSLWRWVGKRPIHWNFSFLYLVLLGGGLAT